jgi:hypothetical protein
VGGAKGVRLLVEETKEVARILRPRTKIDPLNNGIRAKVAPII